MTSLKRSRDADLVTTSPGYLMQWLKNCNASAIGVLIFETERTHDLGLCYLFPVIYEDVVVVDDIEFVSSFDELGGFVRAGPDALAYTYKLFFIRRVPCWY